jgi:phosphoenolpyruvate carboxylase
MWTAGNPRVTPEVTRDVCLLARMMAANLYFSQIEDLMFEVSKTQSSEHCHNLFVIPVSNVVSVSLLAVVYVALL